MLILLWFPITPLDILKKDPHGLASTRNFAKRCKRWDYVISSNPYSSDTWREGFPYGYKVLETGYPRNDQLVTATDVDRLAIRAKLGLPDGKKIVLYAPTFRPKYPAEVLDTHPDKEQIISAIMAGLDAESVLAIRDHYFLPAGSAWTNDPRIIDLSAHASTTDVLLATDMLITDYSSIMFDFAVQKRPIIIFAYDKPLYEDMRGMYFDIANDHPGVYCDTLPQLEAALQNDHASTPKARAKLDAFHARFCPWDDGHAAARVCNIVFDMPS
jgi:CDP-glycerol glycerophosphotransferase